MLQVLPYHVIALYSHFAWGYVMLLALRRKFPYIPFRLTPFYAASAWRLEFNATDFRGHRVDAREVRAYFERLCVESN